MWIYLKWLSGVNIILHYGKMKVYAYFEMKIPLASEYILLHLIFTLWQSYCLRYINKHFNKSIFSAIMTAWSLKGMIDKKNKWYSPLDRGIDGLYKEVKFRSGKRTSKGPALLFFVVVIVVVITICFIDWLVFVNS